MSLDYYRQTKVVPKVTILKSETGLKNPSYTVIYLHDISQKLDSFFISDKVIKG